MQRTSPGRLEYEANRESRTIDHSTIAPESRTCQRTLQSTQASLMHPGTADSKQTLAYAGVKFGRSARMFQPRYRTNLLTVSYPNKECRSISNLPVNGRTGDGDFDG